MIWVKFYLPGVIREGFRVLERYSYLLRSVQKQHVFVPQPLTDEISIASFNHFTKFLYNSIGQHALEAVITQEIQPLNLSGISGGMYILHFTTRRGRIGSVKMVRQ